MTGTDTREKIVQEGLRLFLQNGYAATGLKSILEAARVPKGSFYHFFPEGKEAFAAEVVDFYSVFAALTRKELLLEHNATPLLRLRGYFEHYAKYFATRDFQEGCLLGNLSAEISDSSPLIRARLDSAFRAWESDLSRVIALGIDAGEIRPFASSTRIARHLICGWEGALLRMKSEKSSAALDDFIFVTFDALLVPRDAGSPRKR